MLKRASWLLFSAFLAFILISMILAFPRYSLGQTTILPVDANQIQTKLDPALQTMVKSPDPQKSIRFIVHFPQKAEISQLHTIADPLARRTAIVNDLQGTGVNSQSSVEKELLRLQSTGKVSNYRSLWIINSLAVQGSPEAALKIASHPDVAKVRLDEAHKYFQPIAPTQPIREGLMASQTMAGQMPWGIKRIGADKVIELLGIDGQGVTVAIMDTGVDWQHADLIGNYRGNMGDGSFEHLPNWYYPAHPTRTVPIDLHGHGTHVAGTAIGNNGLGVAPGANWIAVAIANESGFAYDSDIHAGFQWLLAPAGDPANAPDIVNNSWGGHGSRTEFLPDVAILEEAGIVTVFAAGNEGPVQGSVQSPGSFPGVIAIGASDDRNQTTWFSSRGPSPLTDEIKPLLVAPGTRVMSALPDNAYGALNGTSMATPHVAGTIALMVSANPTLTSTEIKSLLSSAATPLDQNHPNMLNGWGLLNALDTLITLKPHSFLKGKILHEGIGVANAEIRIIDDHGREFTIFSDQDGGYQQPLPIGGYDIHVSAFLYKTAVRQKIQIESDQTRNLPISLQVKPSGRISGHIHDQMGKPVTAHISLTGTPISLFSSDNGAFEITLPVGEYSAIFAASGYKLEQLKINILENENLTINPTLEGAPSILLIDSGQYRYESASDIYKEALANNNYATDIWLIDDPTQNVPTTADLSPYDIVFWSAPTDSPGSLSANDVLTDYLGTGGNLFISGQNIALFDGGPEFPTPWFRHYLAGEYVAKHQDLDDRIEVDGVEDTLFAGLALSLAHDPVMENEPAPDEVRSIDLLKTQPALNYDNGATAGLFAGRCLPSRIIQLGFGLEKIIGSEDRAAVVDRSITALTAPRQALGVQLQKPHDHEYVLPGNSYRYTIHVQNISEIITDTFNISFDNFHWANKVLTPTVSLGPCDSGLVDFQIEVPHDFEINKSKTLWLSAVSQSDSRFRDSYQLHFKTPGKVLLVDDDRFYDTEDTYEAVLDSLNIPYDLWETGTGGNGRGSPPQELLNVYDYIIWFTGYDWFSPITPEENKSLQNYLAQGGRLFLSSQDFLYYNINSVLVREHFGLIDYRESITPTQTYANQRLVSTPELAGPMPLSYEPYQNFSDGLIPFAKEQTFLWHDQGMPAASAHAGPAGGKVVFFGFPFETLSVEKQKMSMISALSWLSDLG